jgi:uncharacterized phage-like protein YoqJ
MPKDMFKDFRCNNMEKFNCIYDEERDNNLKYMKLMEFIKTATDESYYDCLKEYNREYIPCRMSIGDDLDNA